jgi:hypothetical protein
VEELQRQLHYLVSTQAKDAEYQLSPAAAAGAAALEAAAAKERSAREAEMHAMAQDFRRQVRKGVVVGLEREGGKAEGSVAAGVSASLSMLVSVSVTVCVSERERNREIATEPG